MVRTSRFASSSSDTAKVPSSTLGRPIFDLAQFAGRNASFDGNRFRLNMLFQDAISCYGGVSLVLRCPRVGRLRRRSSRFFGQVNCLNFLPGNSMRSLSQPKAEMTSCLRFSVLRNGKACSRKHSCLRLLRSSHSAARFRLSLPFIM
jgi:hypothetical protein